MEFKRLTLFAGHYGSGKTNIALNYARALNRDHNNVVIADLDIVNPYFRTKDSEAALKAEGIGLIVSEFANSNLDVPAMPKEIYALVDDRSQLGVLDIGGDDRGALALGRYTPAIAEENNYEMLLVVNMYRPLTRIVNNSNLGPLTTAQTVLNSIPYAQEISRKTGLPVKMTCAKEDLCPSLAGQVENLFPLSLQKLYYQIDSEVPYGETDV